MDNFFEKATTLVCVDLPEKNFKTATLKGIWSFKSVLNWAKRNGISINYISTHASNRETSQPYLNRWNKVGGKWYKADRKGHFVILEDNNG